MNTYMKCQTKLFLIVLVLLMASCKKNWLDAKPDKSLVVPTTLADFQALLDNSTTGLSPFNINQSVLGEIGAGDFSVTDASFDFVSLYQRNAYIWAHDIYVQEPDYNWSTAYKSVLSSNIVLEGVEKIIPGNNSEQQQWNQIKGSALFYRAYRLYDVAQIYSKAYDKNTASSDLGIPLRLESDFNVASKRASLEDTYRQILGDLKTAAVLLPVDKPGAGIIDAANRLRPTKAAANAMLARIYLAMSEYDSAISYANKTLNVYSDLMDYNVDINPSGFFRLPRFNKEVIFHMDGATELINGVSRLLVDSSIIKSYDANDLRKSVFIYTVAPFFLGNYTGSGTFFTGLATDEMYLIRAECYARAGNKDAALADLNALMIKRWSNNGTWQPYTATTANDALIKILAERRKELCYRCIRWSDLKRLNKDPQFAVTLTRIVKGVTYTLQPNSLRYVLPIPEDIILLTGMQQNPR